MLPPDRFNDEFGSSDDGQLLRTLVYCSSAATGVDAGIVSQIIATAQTYNSRHGITGILVSGGGLFFQWLEGPPDSVATLMGRIILDSRHNTVVTLTESDDVRERVFGQWDMELVPADGIREVLNDALGEVKDAASKRALRLLMRKLDNADDG